MRNQIDEQSLVTDIVTRHYRTAVVFQKYGIGYCCGAGIPLSLACQIHNLPFETIKQELENACRVTQVSGSLAFQDWSLEFLTHYLLHIHHGYLRQNLPETEQVLARFSEGHRRKFNFLLELEALFTGFIPELLQLLEWQAAVLYPFARQVEQAADNGTLPNNLDTAIAAKNIEAEMNRRAGDINTTLARLRALACNYTPPPGACISHKVCFAKLYETEENLLHQLYLEQYILLPKIQQLCGTVPQENMLIAGSRQQE